MAAKWEVPADPQDVLLAIEDGHANDAYMEEGFAPELGLQEHEQGEEEAELAEDAVVDVSEQVQTPPPREHLQDSQTPFCDLPSDKKEPADVTQVPEKVPENVPEKVPEKVPEANEEQSTSSGTPLSRSNAKQFVLDTQQTLPPNRFAVLSALRPCSSGFFDVFAFSHCVAASAPL